MHVYVRIHQQWTFDQVRRAALAFAREVERRAPALATSKWWKEERHGVFIDYNQNAKDRTIASAYSVRPKPDARVSAPLTWDEIDSCEPEDFTLATMPSRFASIGDRHAAIDDHPCAIDRLLDLSAGQERDGLGDAPWPPNYKKQPGEPARVQPSRRRMPKDVDAGGCPEKPRRSRSVRSLRSRVQAKKTRRSRGSSAGRRAIPTPLRTLKPADILVDAMRGRFHTWTRIRVNLQHVPSEIRPPQEALDPDEAPNDWANVSEAEARGVAAAAQRLRIWILARIEKTLDSHETPWSGTDAVHAVSRRHGGERPRGGAARRSTKGSAAAWVDNRRARRRHGSHR
jgi:hypothetical protein